MFGIPIHRLVVHFPIALALIAVLYDSWGLYAKKPELHRVGYGLTLWAAVGALAAIVTGLQLAQMIRIDKGAVTGHAGYAIISAILLVALGGVRYSAQARERYEYAVWWLGLGAVAAGFIVATAVTGHRL
jgi:uncharacterized membrane protein